MKKYQHENDLQADAIKMLEYMEKDGLAVFGTRSGVYSGRVKSGAYFKTGCKGLQDMTYCVMGIYLALECKLPVEKQSDEQKEVEKRVKKAGGVYHVFDSLESLVGILELYFMLDLSRYHEMFKKIENTFFSCNSFITPVICI